jgi:lipoprotein NlpI
MDCLPCRFALIAGLALCRFLVAEPVAAAEPTAASSAAAARIEAAGNAIERNPNDTVALGLRASLYAANDQHERAIADYDRLLKLDPHAAEAYDQRGSQYFMLGHIRESIEDFDRFIELRPAQERSHWKRGISYYYAGRYDEGRRQFEGYQTFDDNDVENAVWRYLCMARAGNVAAAREAMLPIRRDARVPMMEVYALYRGEATDDDVLAACRAGSPAAEALNARLFYAHLYLGLHDEAAGRSAQAREHITRAATRHKIGHYMWHVANVHARLLERAAADLPGEKSQSDR